MLHTSCLHSMLTGWLIGWLAGSLTDWLAVWLTGWLIGVALMFFSFYVLAYHRVIVYDKDLMKQVLVTESYKFNRPPFVREMIPAFANGLFDSSGKLHARQRKMINPAFSFANIKQFVPAFEASAQELVRVIPSFTNWSKMTTPTSSVIINITKNVELWFSFSVMVQQNGRFANCRSSWWHLSSNTRHYR